MAQVADKPLMDVMMELEVAVKGAREKEGAMKKLEEQLTFASKEYGDSVEKVNKLRAGLNDRLGNLFPDQANARVSVR